MFEHLTSILFNIMSMRYISTINTSEANELLLLEVDRLSVDFIRYVFCGIFHINNSCERGVF